MAISRANLVKGPCKITWASNTIFSVGDVSIEIVKERVDIESSAHGIVDEVLVDAMVRVRFTPVSKWAYNSLLYPHLNPTIGARIFGDSDTALVITARDGSVYTILAAAITRMPSLSLNVRNNVFGEVEFTGVRANGMDGSDADSLLTITSTTYADTTFAASDLVRQNWTGAWGSVTGFTAIQPKEGWSVDFELGLSPDTVDGIGTVDMSIQSLKVMAKCIPIGPTAAQLLTNLRIMGTAIGTRQSANAADLTISGESAGGIVLNQAQLVEAGYVFGNQPLRNGEIGFVTTIEQTTGVNQAVAVFS